MSFSLFCFFTYLNCNFDFTSFFFNQSSQDGCEEDFDTSVIEEYSVPLQLVSFRIRF